MHIINNKWLSILIRSVCVCLLVTLFSICYAASFLVKDDNIESRLDNLKGDTDIVILMGSFKNRMLGAYDDAQLLDVNQIYMVRSYMENFEQLSEAEIAEKNQADLTKHALIEKGIAEDKLVIIDGQADSTSDEVKAVYNYLDTHEHADNLVIVTSKSHARRSAWMFMYAFRNTGIKIFASPTAYDTFNSDTWFLDTTTRKTVMLEYIKILHFLIIEQWGL